LTIDYSFQVIRYGGIETPLDESEMISDTYCMEMEITLTEAAIRLGIGRVTLWRLVKAERAPQPVRFVPGDKRRTALFILRDINDFGRNRCK
jgi:hypothetical protein